MTKARKQQISLESTPYYHCVTRCVRRAFLCGEDRQTGQSFEHRRGWIEDRLLELQTVFAIDIAAYAVMSNHYHVVLHVNKAQAENWSELEVAERWQQLFKGTLLTQKFARKEKLEPAEYDAVSELVAVWRKRLMDISWFIRCTNEFIARKANEEDQCTGRFWEGRFKSQALLDEKALAACMAYVDLNPIRAAMAETPETSEYTSVKSRCEKAKAATSPNHKYQQPNTLMPFVGNPREPMPEGLPFKLTEYLELVDWTGRHLRSDKPGAIDSKLPLILNRLGIDIKHWLYMTQHFESRFKGLVGSVYSLKKACQSLGMKRISGLSACSELME
ncbi:transposase [Marinibactrum halimedae]|uniref:Transposase n=1 Tax=Marinibactrum halimedae TaxID=1444977 RepID=A0AA37T6C8_9GAMM|nr:transposase [Marinibactrum halimedae]MCD9458602.1 hypothetical protein [Marinibactrum halimedae]GLS26529.1 transposase [Marinibactrum halimedae]